MSVHSEDRPAATHVVHGNPDMRAAFMGLIAGAVALLVIVYVIVRLTNASFDDHAAPANPAAATTPH
jgi:hypothetical protein